MGVGEIDRFLEQWQMDARDLHRPFQMHHSFPWPSTRSPGQWPVWWFVRRPIAGNALPLGRGHVLVHRTPYPGKGRCPPRSLQESRVAALLAMTRVAPTSYGCDGSAHWPRYWHRGAVADVGSVPGGERLAPPGAGPTVPEGPPAFP